MMREACGLPVSKHHGLLQTLSASFMEPLLTPETLQHFQVPPTHTTDEHWLTGTSIIYVEVCVCVCLIGGSYSPGPSQ